MSARLSYISHPDSERFDEIQIRTVENWSETETVGSGWVFSYVVSFFSHGRKLAETSGTSVEHCLVKALSEFKTISILPEDQKIVDEVFCCQPGCPEPWVVLKKPVKAYSSDGRELAHSHGPGDVRGFCVKHANRGDADPEDNDRNYIIIDT
jgi:hypothetical protein